MNKQEKKEIEEKEMAQRRERLQAAKEHFFRSDAAATIDCDSNPFAQDNFYYKLCQQYADVPEQYYPRWMESDNYLSANGFWPELLVATDKAVQEVSAACRYLETKTDRMTVSRLRSEKASLLRAIHKMEELLDALDSNYPTEGMSIYDLAKQDTTLTDRIPEILLNDSDQVLLWTPRLPPKNKWASNIGYRELQELLQKESSNLPHFDQWHADFFHVFHPRNLVGVKDVDNYAHKPIIDTLARAFYTNDAYDNFSCSMFNLPSESLKIGCYIHVYKRCEKVGFFRDFEDLALEALEAKNTVKNP